MASMFTYDVFLVMINRCAKFICDEHKRQVEIAESEEKPCVYDRDLEFLEKVYKELRDDYRVPFRNEADIGEGVEVCILVNNVAFLELKLTSDEISEDDLEAKINGVKRLTRLPGILVSFLSGYKYHLVEYTENTNGRS